MDKQDKTSNDQPQSSTEKRPVGRPSLYSPELLKKANDYIDLYESLGHAIPSHKGLCIYLGIHSDTAYDWAKQEDKKDFSDTLKQIQMHQEHVLLNKGLLSQVNSSICKLALGNHGYSDKQQSEISGPNGQPIEQSWTIEFVDAKDNDK